MELRERILTKASETFFSLGIKAVTMDDIANALGISKKTLYGEFKNKETLVIEVMRTYLLEDKKVCDCNVFDSTGAIEEILHLMEHMNSSLSKINPLLVLETYKYYPKAWALFDEHKEKFILTKMEENLARGIEEGVYRKDIDVSIIARLKLGHVDIVSDGKLFPIDKFDFVKVHQQLMNQYLYGICSIKGHQIVNDYLKINE